MLYYFRYFLFFFFTGLCTNLQGQVSLKVGYAFGKTDPTVTNGIIQRYNETNDFLADPLEEIKFLSGFDLGVRVRNEFVGAELSWGNKYNRLNAKGTNPITSSEYFREIFLRYGHYSFGLETYIGILGFGGSIDLNRASFRTRDTEETGKVKLLAETGYSSHFFVSVHFEGSGNTSFTLRPYIQVPWKGVNLYKLEQELNPEFAVTTSPDDYNERFLNFGLKVIFFNGN